MIQIDDRKRIRAHSVISAIFASKYFKCLVLLLIAFLFVRALQTDWEIVLNKRAIPLNYISKEEHSDPREWRDFYTNYYKFQYRSAKPFEKDERYHVVTEEDIPEIMWYYQNFRRWMETGQILDEFDFDPACINAGNYFLIDDRSTTDSFYRKYKYYSLYLFDRESLILYSMHHYD